MAEILATDNSIDWERGQDMATCTFTMKRFITKIEKLAEKYPDDVKIIHRNEDGTVVAHMPISYIHLSNAKKNLSDDENDSRAELMRLGKEIKTL